MAATLTSVSPTTAQPALDRENSAPARAGLVLSTLIVAAAVANLPLGMANVAMPSIGKAFDASQTQLNLVAVGYSLGLACSVLWFGALGDRYGRKLLLMLGLGLAIPAALIAGFAPSITILIGARIFGGVAAGMAFPTTLALITALWSGQPRTRAIALWVGTGSAISALGTMLSGFLLQYFDWGSVFLVVIPLAGVALAMAYFFVPAHSHEETDPVDNLGGLLSLVMVGALTLAINFSTVRAMRTEVLVLAGLVLITGAWFVYRQLHEAHPLYDLRVASRRTFWVAGCSGTIVFGALMGAMFLGQQFIQVVLGYSTIDASMAILPSPVCTLLVAGYSAHLVRKFGSRFTLLAGFLFILLSFVTMLLLWKEGIPYWPIGLAYALVGIGVGLAGTPSSNALTGSVPVARAGMASGTADLQRDLGGAIMQSVFGALLAGGYAVHMAAAVAKAPQAASAAPKITSALEMSISGAQTVAAQYPQYAEQILTAARASFLAGDQQAYLVGIAAVLGGAALTFFLFPKHQAELDVLAQYRSEDPAYAEGGAQAPSAAQ